MTPPATPEAPGAAAPLLQAVLIDDEPLARRRLARLLTAHADVRVVGEAEDAETGAEAVRSLRPDVLFLDVQMPGADGFALLDALDLAPAPHVIFTTAHAVHAVRAFDVAAVDFLLKPIDEERLARALARARAGGAARAAAPEGGGGGGAGDASAVGRAVRAEVEALLARLRPAPAYLERLAVVSSRRTVFVPVADVDWIGAEGNYARVYAAGRQYLMRATMQALEAQLDPARFARVHRSTIVHLDRVHELRTVIPGEYRLVLRDGTQLEVHRTYRHRLPQPP